MIDKRPGMATRAVHGPVPDLDAVPRGLATPVHTSTAWELSPEAYAAIEADGGYTTTWYTRLGNPTVDAVARRLAALENTDGALLFASGIAAIGAVLGAFTPAGGRIVAARELYGDTLTLLRQELPQSGRTTTFVPVDALDAWERALGEGADLVYVETLSNPMLRAPDLAAIAELAHAAGALAVVDATFTTPVNVRPADHGFDVVVHSATKYLNGHSDVIAGVACADAASIERLRPHAALAGGSLSPQSAALLERGLKTLPLRMERHNANALRVAAHLDASLEVEAVHHPGLPSHPDHELVRRHYDGASGMVSFRMRGGDQRALAFMAACRVILQSTSLGGVESLVSAPHNTSHLGLPRAELNELGILPGTVRLSVGIEDVEDLVADIDQALEVSAPVAAVHRGSP